MDRANKFRLFIIFLIICITIVSSGCSSSNQQQGQSQPQPQENEKKPDKLKEIEGNVEAMIGMLSGVPNEPAKAQQESGQSQGGQQSGGQQPAEKGLLEPKTKVNWEQALKDVEKIHTQWNDYISISAKDGVPKNSIDAFSNSLNELTNQIGAKNGTGALLAANNLNFYLASFWMVYDSKVPPDLKRLKYHLRNTIYYADLIKWIKVEENLNVGKSLFESIKTTAPEEKQEAVNKLDFSVQELEKVVKAKNPPLIKLKGKLTIDNLQELEKGMESSGGS